MAKFPRNPWGGVTPLYQVYRYVPPQKVWLLSRFGLKTGIDFKHFGLKLGMVIGGKLKQGKLKLKLKLKGLIHAARKCAEVFLILQSPMFVT